MTAYDFEGNDWDDITESEKRAIVQRLVDSRDALSDDYETLAAEHTKCGDGSLACALCLYVEDGGRFGRAKLADTIIEGYAVCDDHLGYVAQGQRFAGILSTLRGEP